MNLEHIILTVLVPEREREATERSVVVVAVAAVVAAAVVVAVADGSQWVEAENLPSWPQPLSEVPQYLAEE